MVSHRYVKYMAVVVFLVSLTALSCDNKSDSGKAKDASAGKQTKFAEGFFGWDSLIIQNQFVRLDVVPELGGKIMGFSLHGLQILWHNKNSEGKIETGQGYGSTGTFVNPGGAKVWPAPQGWKGEGEWPGPPDDVIDSAPYQFERQDDTIVVTSPEDNGQGRTGLQFTHAYTVKGSNSKAFLDLSMKNIVDRPVTWGLWHLATVPVDRAFTLYVPVNSNDDWHVMFGDADNPQWLGVENGVFRARYDQRVGKVGMKVREGWAAWHDEANGIVYAMLFPVEKGKNYPDGGSNFEVWTQGAGSISSNGTNQTYEYSPESANMELEVMGPLTTLSPGQSTSMKVEWAVTRCSGVKRVTPTCVVVEELRYDGSGIKGRFGVFHAGNLETIYMKKDGTVVSHQVLAGVSPVNEVIIDQDNKYLLTMHADKVLFQIISLDKKETSVIGEVALK